jgi:hypothetical protein
LTEWGTYTASFFAKIAEKTNKSVDFPTRAPIFTELLNFGAVTLSRACRFSKKDKP